MTKKCKSWCAHLEGIAAKLQNTLLALALGIVLGRGIVGLADALGQNLVDGFAAVVRVVLGLQATVGLGAKLAEVDAVDAHFALAIVVFFFRGQAGVTHAFELGVWRVWG